MTGWKISYFHFIYFVLALLNDIPIKMARVDKVSLQLLATALRTQHSSRLPRKLLMIINCPNSTVLPKQKHWLTLLFTSSCGVHTTTTTHTQLSCATATIYCIYRSQVVIKWYSFPPFSKKYTIFLHF